MDILKVLEQFGIPVAKTIAFGFFIWRQNQFIQTTLMNELDEDFKRLEGIIIKLIDQQKLVQMKVEKFQGIYEALIEVYARKDEQNTDKIMRIMEQAKDE